MQTVDETWAQHAHSMWNTRDRFIGNQTHLRGNVTFQPWLQLASVVVKSLMCKDEDKDLRIGPQGSSRTATLQLAQH